MISQKTILFELELALKNNSSITGSHIIPILSESAGGFLFSAKPAVIIFALSLCTNTHIYGLASYQSTCNNAVWPNKALILLPCILSTNMSDRSLFSIFLGTICFFWPMADRSSVQETCLKCHFFAFLVGQKINTRQNTFKRYGKHSVKLMLWVQFEVGDTIYRKCNYRNVWKGQIETYRRSEKSFLWKSASKQHLTL